MLLFLFTLTSLCFSIYSINSPWYRYRRQTNGCGPVTLNIDRFLQDIGEEVLIECCNEHDLCYDTCGQKQITCDTKFLHCMIQTCQQLSPIANVKRCQEDSRILFWIVFFAGGTAFQQAQQQHQCFISNQITNITSNEHIKQ